MDNLNEMVNDIARGVARDEVIFKTALAFSSMSLNELLATFDADLMPLIYKYPHISLYSAYNPDESHWNENYNKDHCKLGNGLSLHLVLETIGTHLQNELEDFYGISTVTPLSIYQESSYHSGINFNGAYISSRALNFFARYTFTDLYDKEEKFRNGKNPEYVREAYFPYVDMCRIDPIHTLVKEEKDFYKRNFWVFNTIEYIYKLSSIFGYFTKFAYDVPERPKNPEYPEGNLSRRYFQTRDIGVAKFQELKSCTTTRRDAKDNPPFQGTMSPEGGK